MINLNKRKYGITKLNIISSYGNKIPERLRPPHNSIKYTRSQYSQAHFHREEFS